MWILYASASAFFAGITAILAKCGMKRTGGTVATAVRTIVVLIFAWLMVFAKGVAVDFSTIAPKTWLFLILSGLATGASWLCYFEALQLGDVNKVVPIDKSSTVLTVLLAFLLLGETVSFLGICGVILIAGGTFLMLEKAKQISGRAEKGHMWLILAILSAVFAALTAILGKVGISDVNSDLGTAIRTGVVLVMAWMMVFVTGKTREVSQIPRSELVFICVSGLSTGASWLFYYRALQLGPASVVVPIDKLSILITVLFSFFILKEKLTRRSALGLMLVTLGTLIMTLA